MRLDQDFCEQVFVNLVQNAYEAMADQGGGTLRVSIARARKRGHDGVEVRVADTGPGIAGEIREQIFNPFVTTKKTGVGLGLSIVSKIVDEHHGLLELTSATAQSPSGNRAGACFVVFFPLAEEAVQIDRRTTAAITH